MKSILIFVLLLLAIGVIHYFYVSIVGQEEEYLIYSQIIKADHCNHESPAYSKPIEICRNRGWAFFNKCFNAMIDKYLEDGNNINNLFERYKYPFDLKDEFSLNMEYKLINNKQENALSSSANSFIWEFSRVFFNEDKTLAIVLVCLHGKFRVVHVYKKGTSGKWILIEIVSDSIH
jgi:hypothetical protein